MKNNLTVYEREVRSNLLTIKVLFVIYVLLNLFLPLYKDNSLAYHSIISYLAIIIAGIGCWAMFGHLNQWVPLFPLILLRIAEFIFKFIKPIGPPIYLFTLIILVIFDIMICAYMMIDRAQYYYVREDESDEL